MAGYDYLIPLNDKNKLYVGAHAGVSSFKGKDEISDYLYVRFCIWSTNWLYL